MESTGVYWMVPFQILEQYGLEVLLIDARLARNLLGRKSDVLDCQWHQQLHTFGLLRGCFLPAAEIVPLRSYLRLRDELVGGSSQSIQHMQKALFEMNVQLANVISDISGETGLAIIEAILAGERDGKKLALLKHRRIVASKETIAKSLEGNWRPELLFALQTALERYKFYQQQIAQVILSELGPDLQKSFQSEKHFSSYLGLCPGTTISGGKVLKRRSRKVKHRVATALRLAARSLHSCDSALGANFRRLRARLGARSEEHTSELQSHSDLVCRLLLEKK